MALVHSNFGFSVHSLFDLGAHTRKTCKTCCWCREHIKM